MKHSAISNLVDANLLHPIDTNKRHAGQFKDFLRMHLCLEATSLYPKDCTPLLFTCNCIFEIKILLVSSSLRTVKGAHLLVDIVERLRDFGQTSHLRKKNHSRYKQYRANASCNKSSKIPNTALKSVTDTATTMSPPESSSKDHHNMLVRATFLVRGEHPMLS